MFNYSLTVHCWNLRVHQVHQVNRETLGRTQSMCCAAACVLGTHTSPLMDRDTSQLQYDILKLSKL